MKRTIIILAILALVPSRRDTRRLYYASTVAVSCPYEMVVMYSDKERAAQVANKNNALRGRSKWRVFCVDVPRYGTLVDIPE